MSFRAAPLPSTSSTDRNMLGRPAHSIRSILGITSVPDRRHWTVITSLLTSGSERSCRQSGNLNSCEYFSRTSASGTRGGQSICCCLSAQFCRPARCLTCLSRLDLAHLGRNSQSAGVGASVPCRGSVGGGPGSSGIEYGSEFAPHPADRTETRSSVYRARGNMAEFPSLGQFTACEGIVSPSAIVAR
jgi:hypothetical protein